MNYKNIVVAGGGILGSQIAFQSAYCGFNVTILIRKEDSTKEVEDKLKKLHDTYLETINLMDKDNSNWARGISEDIHSFDKEKCLDKVGNALDNITIETNI